jgi:hypothetical protein
VAMGHFNVSDFPALKGVVAAAQDLEVAVSSGFLKVSAIPWVTNRFPRWVASFRDEDGISALSQCRSHAYT